MKEPKTAKAWSGPDAEEQERLRGEMTRMTSGEPHSVTETGRVPWAKGYRYVVKWYGERSKPFYRDGEHYRTAQERDRAVEKVIEGLRVLGRIPAYVIRDDEYLTTEEELARAEEERSKPATWQGPKKKP